MCGGSSSLPGGVFHGTLVWCGGIGCVSVTSLPSFSACFISISTVISSVVPPRQTQRDRICRLYSKIGHPRILAMCRSLWFIVNCCFQDFEARRLYYWIASWVMVLLEVFTLTWALRGVVQEHSTSLLQAQTAAFM